MWGYATSEHKSVKRARATNSCKIGILLPGSSDSLKTYDKSVRGLMLFDIKNTVIRDNIEGNRLIEISDKVRQVIDTKEFQRLRHIKQTGLTSYVFPTAEHSRFAHSLGVFATAKQAFRQLQRRAVALDIQTQGLKFDEHSETEFCIAALCHDIGHSAYSHVLEQVLRPQGITDHEECTLAILQGDTEVAQAIDGVADRDAVQNLIGHRSPNNALGDLISSTFDVDRCDYILRDSRMAGVEYGKFDLKWLFHAMTIELNSALRPVLQLDGPRGLDALRQFLSARRYLHRQVYYHPTVRGGEILLKGIFARMQDVGSTPEIRTLCPPSLHPILAGERPTLEQFLDTTDVEINFMIRSFARSHPDPTLKYLCRLFVRREFPKCVLDTSKMGTPISQKYRIAVPTDADTDYQQSFLKDLEPAHIRDVVDDLKAFVAKRLEESGLPPAAAPYLTAFDPARFRSTPPTDLQFSFRGDVVPWEKISEDCVGFNLSSLLESFSINRIFVPREFQSEASEYVAEAYRV